MGGREAVKPSPVEAIPPGIPVAEDRMEWSIADRKLVSVGGMGTAAAGTAIAIPPATSGGGAAASEPSYKGAMPLVRPAIQAVAATAMLKERGGASSGQGSGAAGKSGPQDQQDERGIDLDSLAVEMAERIMRRLKREKERRGFHG
jgi:hypothetical protein